MGVKTPIEVKESLQECVYCNIRYPVETRFCDSCSRPLNVNDAMQMEKEQEERTKSLILETLRQEHSNKSKSIQTDKMQNTIKEQSEKIQELSSILQKLSQK